MLERKYDPEHVCKNISQEQKKEGGDELIIPVEAVT